MRFVRHSVKSEWGLGVIAGEDSLNLDIIFESQKRLKVAKSFKGLVEIEDGEVPSDHPLRNLGGWAKAERDGKRAGAKRELPKGFDQFVAEFLKVFPGGLRSKECDDEERNYKVEKSTYARKELAADVLEPMLARGEYSEILVRVRKSLKLNLVFPNELIKFGAIPAASHKEIAERLVRLITASDETPKALEELAAALKPHDAAKWTIVSLIPFLLDPERWPFVKPTFLQRTEKALGIEVEYDAQPNARTYELVCDLYEQVKGLLEGLGREDFVPRDFIDVQTFLWVASGMKREAK